MRERFVRLLPASRRRYVFPSAGWRRRPAREVRMTDSTVKDLSPLSGASPAGLQAADLLYVLRPGSPDADFKAAGSDLSAFVGTLGYVPGSRTVNGHALSGDVIVS